MARFDAIGLIDILPKQARKHGPNEVDTSSKQITAAPSQATPPELESSQPPSSEPQDATPARQRWNDPPINRWRLLAACIVSLGGGANDGAPGALLPYIEQYYSIGYAVVSTIFIANAAGFILAAFFVQMLDSRIGRAKTLLLNEIIIATDYVIMAIAPPFPVFAIAYFMVGYGLATNLAVNNVFTANLANPTVVLGVFHGAYGVGALLSPLLATTLVVAGVKFSYFFFILIGIRCIAALSSALAFRHFERDAQTPQAHQVDLRPTSSTPPQTQPPLLDALKNKTTLLGALFIFAYQGAEVSISGWIISFLITYRHGAPSKVGYVTSGFWAGVTLGRLTLNNLAPRIGEKHFTVLLILGAIVFEFVVLFAPNVVADSVATAVVGLLIGPLYPCALTVFSRLLPRKVQQTALAFVSSAGSSGGAVAPFVVGLISQAKGTWTLHPVVISLFGGMVVCWVVLTRGYEKRRE